MILRPLTLAALAAFAGVIGNAQAQVVNNPVQPTVVFPVTTQIDLGPTLDVVPVVLSDGFTINMTLIPSLTEFVGYETLPPPPTIPGAITVPPVAPAFRVRQVTTTVNVWDGQTVVLGGLIASDSQRLKDKVPVLGDLPFFGRFFRSESNVTRKKNLIIFVTPTIIDPSGNRVHTDDEMPFAPSALTPPKPQAAPATP